MKQNTNVTAHSVPACLKLKHADQMDLPNWANKIKIYSIYKQVTITVAPRYIANIWKELG